MRKRILSLLLAAVLLLGLIPAAFAEEPAEPETIAYPVEGGNLYFDPAVQKIVKADQTITAAVIPAEINGVPVKEIYDCLFYYNTTLRSVTITAELDYIGESAFSQCTALEEVDLRSVKKIGNRVFSGSTKLKTVTLGAVEEIDYSAFSACTALETVTLPEGLKHLSWNVFAYSTALTSVTLPESLESMESAVFRGCTALSTLPTLPEGLLEIGTNVFFDTAFWNDDANWTDDLLYDQGWLLGSRLATREAATIAEGTRHIAGGVFYDHRALASVTLPEGLISISERAFGNNYALTKIEFPASLKYIGSEAFYGSANLMEAHFLGDAPEFGRRAFYYEKYANGESEILPFRDLTLYYRSGRAGWDDIYEYVAVPWDGGEIPSGLIDIEIDGATLRFNPKTGAITQCIGRPTHVEIPEKIDGIYVRRISEGAFAEQCDLISVTIPKYVRYIGVAAFGRCTSLKTIALPEKMQAIDASAFHNCTVLESITMPKVIARLGNAAFENCYALQSADLPEGLTKIPYRSFKYCRSLRRVTIPEGVVTVVGEAFAGCNQLSEAVLPESLEIFGGDAFLGCAFETLVLPPKTRKFSDWTFGGCGRLKTLTIPASIESMGYCAFQDCKSLQEVYFLGDAPADLVAAFMGCPDVTIYYREGTTGWTTPEWNGYPTYPLHDFSVAQVVAPTCTEQGYTLQRCACGAEEKTDLLAPLGHNYQNGVCTRCGQSDPDAPAPVAFDDIPANAWYKDAVSYAVRAGLMNGVGAGRFDPEGSMTRAMLVTVLWRNAGSPQEGENTFADVPDGTWYTAAVAWAAKNGVVNGVGNGKFDPDGAITREQMTAILLRFAAANGVDTSKRADLSSFPDAGSVSAWAKDALAWTVAEGIIGGSDGKLLPQGNATRAQVAAILMRFLALK